MIMSIATNITFYLGQRKLQLYNFETMFVRNALAKRQEGFKLILAWQKGATQWQGTNSP